MPGMIPMFIVARRRRFYHSDVGGSSSYSGERSSCSMQLSRTGVGSRLLWQEGCLLEPTAREAKERLDEKLLKSQRKSEMNITTTPNTRLIKQVNQISHEDNFNMRSSSSLAPAAGVVRRQLLPNGQQVRGTTTTLTSEVLGSGLKRRFIVGAKKLVGKWAGSGGWKRLVEEERRLQQQECCVVCLDKLRDDNSDQKQVVTTLPCAHKFHSSCLLPWLQTNSHCPCCRTHISF